MTRFVIPMPGWSASMVAPSDHRGFFKAKRFVCVPSRIVWLDEPALHDFARFIDSLLRMR
jgi:hypothetical protein